jgi:hypothetical protein
MHFSAEKLCWTAYLYYLCTVFFMVLDLRLTMKIVVVVRQPFLFYRGSVNNNAPFYYFQRFPVFKKLWKNTG